jgi:DNA repair protein RadA/Sms
MTGAGLREIANPSELFLSERDLGSPGTAVFAGIEGTPPAAGRDPGAGRPDLARHAAPRRGRLGPEPAVDGARRARRRIAACGSRATTSISTSPAGLRIQEPAADLAAAAALVSSLANAPLPADAVYFGEISLSGAVRPVAQAAARLKEAKKLGFRPRHHPEAVRAEGAASPAVAQSVTSLATWSDIAAQG